MGSLSVARWRREMRIARALRIAAILAPPRRITSPNRVRRGSRSALEWSENMPRSKVSSLMIKLLRLDTLEPWLSNSARAPACSRFVVAADTMGVDSGGDHPRFCIAAFTAARIKFVRCVKKLEKRALGVHCSNGTVPHITVPCAVMTTCRPDRWESAVTAGHRGSCKRRARCYKLSEHSFRSRLLRAVTPASLPCPIGDGGSAPTAKRAPCRRPARSRRSPA